MIYSELIHGNVYRAKSGSSSYLIVASLKENQAYISLNANIFSINGGFRDGWPGNYYEPALQEEVLWLNECIKQNKFVERDKITIPSYSIF